MHVHKDINQLPAFINAVITIGTFDGVHTGHQQIIELMKQEAKAIGGETIIITFHPHPRQVISNKSKPVYLLNTLEEKIALLKKYGIHHVVIIPFTEAFANQSAEQYIADFLVKTFKPHTIIIGHDHRFGKDRAGDYSLLEDKAALYNYVVKEIPGYMLHNSTISSTKIREALLNNDIATANQFLGYSYFFSGSVIEGNKLGRTIGYPTANLKVEDEYKLVPGNAVYAVEVFLEKGNIGSDESELLMLHSPLSTETPASNAMFKGMMNIGVRPTVDGTTRMIEVNIFDFDEEIYGRQLTVFIKRQLRSEIKFNGLDALKQQLAKDKTEALKYLS